MAVALAMPASIGCERAPEGIPRAAGGPDTAPAAPPAPTLPERSFTRLRQRAEVRLPTENPLIVVSVGDVTRGRVSTTISSVDGGTIAGPRSLGTNDSLDFEFHGRAHALRIVALENSLLGEDFVQLEITGAAQGAPSGQPGQTIEALIDRVARLTGIEFIRNGTVHAPADAAEHMRRKWQAAGDRVRTPEEFIEICGSRSSVSGEPYMIRLEDGRMVESRDFLLELLRHLKRSP